MNPIRREVLNGLFVIVLSTLLSAAIAAFQVKFDIQLWVWIVMAVAIAITGYVIFEFAIGFMTSTEEREKASEESTRRREEEWLKRVGTPARLAMNLDGEPLALAAITDAVKGSKAGSDYIVLFYIGPEGLVENVLPVSAERSLTLFATLLEGVRLGGLREYKRIFCFDRDVLAEDRELKAGVLRVGEGPGTITRQMGEHCRLMMQTKGCSLYVAPAVLRHIVGFYGTDKVSITVETTAADTGGRAAAGVIFFCDPPNGEIVEQFRELERETERRMVAVHKIVFPEDAVSTAEVAR
jgi:hypothetical protein